VADELAGLLLGACAAPQASASTNVRGRRQSGEERWGFDMPAYSSRFWRLLQPAGAHLERQTRQGVRFGPDERSSPLARKVTALSAIVDLQHG
jgi:hypothetical protein